MQPPEELIEHHNKRKVWKLNKAIYGLKQSGRAWNEHLNKTLIKLNFSRSQTDPCIYVKKNKADLLIITVYVDDLLILSNNEEGLLILKKELSRTFKMKDLGEATYLLGLAITRDRKAGKIWLDQSSYTNRIIQEYGVEDCNPVSTPVDPSIKLSSDMEPKNEEDIEYMKKVPYREAVGKL